MKFLFKANSLLFYKILGLNSHLVTVTEVKKAINLKFIVSQILKGNAHLCL